MNREPWILGLGGSHNGGACLLRGSEVIVAVQKERLTGVKRDWLWAAEETLSVRYCLDAAGIAPEDLDAIAVSGLPSSHLPRHDVRRNPVVGHVAGQVPIVTVGHHRAHAASAYGLSGFSDAAILVIDGAGTPYGDLDAAERDVAAPHDGSKEISML